MAKDSTNKKWKLAIITVTALTGLAALGVSVRHHEDPLAKEQISALSLPLQSTIQAVQELEETYPYRKYKEAGAPAYFGAGKNYNLIVVQLESVQNFLLNTSVHGQELTPVMNQLAAESLYFPYIFQQMGRGNTSDAEFLSNTSIYPVGNKPMSYAYAEKKLPSLARLMHKLGYKAWTFHVNQITFWNRDQLYKALNFDQYFDKPYFRKQMFNRFGASDEELFRVGLHKLTALQAHRKPFYAQFITASSHAPFTIPAASKRLKLPEHLQAQPLGDYLTAANYADYALGTFIDGLKKNGLWEKSVVVVYGDHFGLNRKKFKAKEVSQALGIAYHRHITRFNVPLMIHLPGQSGRVVEQVGGQVDILPTVANIMGIDLAKEGFTAFGHDLMNIDHNLIGIRYYLPTGSFFNNDILFIAGKKGISDGKAVSIRTLQPIKDLSPYKSDFEYIKKWMKLSDRYVKELPERKK
ncbi:LTA synthase family protein [Paenibacillus sp. P96]|uniref:LTA synthase family protein n=1 Tax=Paenibacillus zeirhizosphaerae TaxID=2987519 RepID=A0ABT9FVG7_9BACL|nr:LTA synthase family protein [Paenibacillus sp. P96]MDP4098685.1 LTA synthase family protein [Paenibacillus sp. P96]